MRWDVRRRWVIEGGGLARQFASNGLSFALDGGQQRGGMFPRIRLREAVFELAAVSGQLPGADVACASFECVGGFFHFFLIFGGQGFCELRQASGRFLLE